MNQIVVGIPETAEATLRAWIEANMQGRVISVERQPRWRPCWYVEFEETGTRARKPLYVRSRRSQSELLFFPLAHEAEVLRVLHESGIPSPVIYGLCPEPEAIVMDRMPGRPDLSTAEDEAEGCAVLLEYMEILARMHAIPPERFLGAGLEIPRDPKTMAFSLFDLFERIQIAHKRRPAPEVMFVMGWLRRHTPMHRTRPAFITCDSGQFLFDKGHVTSVLDLELAHIGDPSMDIASLLLRDLVQPLGDLTAGCRRYEELAAEPIDWKVVMFYLALWGIMTPMVTHHLSQDPPPDLDHAYNEDQTIVLTRIPLEAIAEMMGVELEPMAPPFEFTGRGGSVALHAALTALRGALADVRPTEVFERYRRNCANEMADYLGILIEHERDVLAQEREETVQLIGRDIAAEGERNAALEELVAASGPERDQELVRFFYRRTARRERMLGPRVKFFVRRDIQRPDRPTTVSGK
jgi:aminoglycoside phosphotransferase (APT) family kinase protein